MILITLTVFRSHDAYSFVWHSGSHNALVVANSLHLKGLNTMAFPRLHLKAFHTPLSNQTSL
ncbi:Hypothetical protein Lpl7_0035 [Lacticaseibacillus paracasei subsp. tolerans Lpl7]|nr:Hypothetical protein Lpl7_0035 [Lacticaseibacillus paracasei subsp. tolerans Lpl7]